MQHAADNHDDVSSSVSATWMDIYVVYSACIGVVSFMMGAVDRDPLLAVWGIWTFCAIAYFARDRCTWSYKCDIAVIAAALPVVVFSGRVLFQIVAAIQIATHFGLLIEWNFMRHMHAAVTEQPTIEDDADCVDM